MKGCSAAGLVRTEERVITTDLWCSSECTPPCQGGGRGFKSRQVRRRALTRLRAVGARLPGRVAQLVERAPEKREVTGSTPVPTTGEVPRLGHTRPRPWHQLGDDLAFVKREVALSTCPTTRTMPLSERWPGCRPTDWPRAASACPTEQGPAPIFTVAQSRLNHGAVVCGDVGSSVVRRMPVIDPDRWRFALGSCTRKSGPWSAARASSRRSLPGTWLNMELGLDPTATSSGSAGFPRHPSGTVAIGRAMCTKGQKLSSLLPLSHSMMELPDAK